MTLRKVTLKQNHLGCSQYILLILKWYIIYFLLKDLIMRTKFL